MLLAGESELTVRHPYLLRDVRRQGLGMAHRVTGEVEAREVLKVLDQVLPVPGTTRGKTVSQKYPVLTNRQRFAHMSLRR